MRPLLHGYAGGGFFCGHPLQYLAEHAKWLQALAAKGVDAKILAVDYLWAPEHPFPAALDAVVAAYDWLVMESGETADVVVGELPRCCFEWKHQGVRSTWVHAAVAAVVFAGVDADCSRLPVGRAVFLCGAGCSCGGPIIWLMRPGKVLMR